MTEHADESVLNTARESLPSTSPGVEGQGSEGRSDADEGRSSETPQQQVEKVQGTRSRETPRQHNTSPPTREQRSSAAFADSPAAAASPSAQAAKETTGPQQSSTSRHRTATREHNTQEEQEVEHETKHATPNSMHHSEGGWNEWDVDVEEWVQQEATVLTDLLKSITAPTSVADSDDAAGSSGPDLWEAMGATATDSESGDSTRNAADSPHGPDHIVPSAWTPPGRGVAAQPTTPKAWVRSAAKTRETAAERIKGVQGTIRRINERREEVKSSKQRQHVEEEDVARRKALAKQLADNDYRQSQQEAAIQSLKARFEALQQQRRQAAADAPKASANGYSEVLQLQGGEGNEAEVESHHHATPGKLLLEERLRLIAGDQQESSLSSSSHSVIKPPPGVEDAWPPLGFAAELSQMSDVGFGSPPPRHHGAASAPQRSPPAAPATADKGTMTPPPQGTAATQTEAQAEGAKAGKGRDNIPAVQGSGRQPVAVPVVGTPHHSPSSSSNPAADLNHRSTLPPLSPPPHSPPPPSPGTAAPTLPQPVQRPSSLPQPSRPYSAPLTTNAAASASPLPSAATHSNWGVQPRCVTVDHSASGTTAWALGSLLISNHSHEAAHVLVTPLVPHLACSLQNALPSPDKGATPMLVAMVPPMDDTRVYFGLSASSTVATDSTAARSAFSHIVSQQSEYYWGTLLEVQRLPSATVTHTGPEAHPRASAHDTQLVRVWIKDAVLKESSHFQLLAAPEYNPKALKEAVAGRAGASLTGLNKAILTLLPHQQYSQETWNELNTSDSQQRQQQQPLALGQQDQASQGSSPPPQLPPPPPRPQLSKSPVLQPRHGGAAVPDMSLASQGSIAQAQRQAMDAVMAGVRPGAYPLWTTAPTLFTSTETVSDRPPPASSMVPRPCSSHPRLDPAAPPSSLFNF